MFSVTVFGQSNRLLRSKPNVMLSSTGSFEFDLYQDNIVFSTSVGDLNTQTYLWVIDDTYSVRTNSPSIVLSANDFVWYPAGGCFDFNKVYWKADLAGSLGKKPYSLGTYTVSFKVIAENNGESVTKTVKVKRVLRCVDGESLFQGSLSKDIGKVDPTNMGGKIGGE